MPYQRRVLSPFTCRHCGRSRPRRPNERPSRYAERSYCSAACRNRAMREAPIHAGHRQPPPRPSIMAGERTRLAALLATLPEAEAALVRRWHGLGSSSPATKGLAMTSKTAAASATTALRAVRGAIKPAESNPHWADWVFATDDAIEAVTSRDYFQHCGQALSRGDRIAVCCHTDVLTKGDRLGPATHALLAVSRCERLPGGQWDIRTVTIFVVRESAADAPALDREGKPLPQPQPAAA